MEVKKIRKLFADHFIKKNHVKINSSELVPNNDPTLLFVNSGMVQFKDYFTGKAQAKNKRAVSVQKCVRAGGKHNDLENVGFTARHHTFFEMLGNFSFGDYFKEDAIKMAWEFLTEVLKIPKEKLYVTVHHSDQEAANIWHEKMGVPKNHIFYRGDKDNFWEMGEVGPCGPCSEIFYDHGPEHSDPNVKTKESILDDESRYVEIWNLVFMQFERYFEDKQIKQRPLPNPCIDTGSGLERVAAALQGKYNNYDTDVFSGIISKLEKLTGKSYNDSQFTSSFRVVADHIRASTMLITDGVIPSNEGRGYVLRRIIRRAVRHLNLLNVSEPILFQLVDEVFKSLGEEYPENLSNKEMAIKFLKLEEDSFRKTLTSGLNLLEKEKSRLQKENKNTLEGEVVFKLYDTHGFPLDLIEVILKDTDFKIDLKGFESLMEEQKQRSRSINSFAAKEDNLKLFYNVKEKHGNTDFKGYETLECKAKLLKIIEINENCFALIFDKTPFYAESGGQVGDTGQIKEMFLNIVNTQKPVEGIHAHIVENVNGLVEGHEYHLEVNSEYRGFVAKNHTATHLLHASLRAVLGTHVKQAGSLVSSQRLRFDFSHPEALSSRELTKVEQMVNENIFKHIPVNPEEMHKDRAMQKGAMALFGEKYGDTVRVLEIGKFSMELCGGTHVKNTGEIHLFKIVSESSLAAGIRRIEGITSYEALKRIEAQLEQLGKVSSLLQTNFEQTSDRVEHLQDLLKDKDKEIRLLKEKLQANQAKQLFDDPVLFGNGHVYKVITVPEASDLRQIGDMFIEKYKSGVVLLFSPKGEKTSVLLRTYKGNHTLNCSDVLRDSLKSFGGSGGGRPEMAQGSIDTNKMKAVEDVLTSQIVK
jgi:alanyl-tRNA synthetase